jgi:hypothetical protein
MKILDFEDFSVTKFNSTIGKESQELGKIGKWISTRICGK